MILEFAGPKLKKICEDHRLATKKWGRDVARALVKRLEQMEAADNLDHLRLISPGARPEPLKGKRKGQYSVRLHAGFRLLFVPAANRKEYETPDGPDWRKVTKIRIMEVVDYHE